METKPIFDFIKEARMPSISLPCSAEELQEYERTVLLERLYNMKACIIDCYMNCPSMDVSIINDDLILLKAGWIAKRELLYGGSITEKRADGGIVVNKKVAELWENKPEARFASLMVNVIGEALRAVNKAPLFKQIGINTETITETPSLQTSQCEKKDVLSVKEVANLYGLPYNNVKDKQRRDKNDFPYQQCIKGGKVVFYADEVEEWVKKRRA